MRIGNNARFLDGNQVATYNLETKAWLPPIALPRSGATVFAEDTNGAVVAYNNAIYRYGPGFAGENVVGTVGGSIDSLFLDGNLVIVLHFQYYYGAITIFNRTTGAVLSTADVGTVNTIFGACHAPNSNRIYGRNNGVSPADIGILHYTNKGVVDNLADPPFHDILPYGAKSWIFQDENHLVSAAGIVRTTPGLEYSGSLAIGITDVAFDETKPIVLSGGDLVAFGPDFLETGRCPVGNQTASKLYILAGEAFVFSQGNSGHEVSVFKLSDIHPQEPVAAVDPNGLAYTADQVFPDNDGNIVLFSRDQKSLFRWSPSSRQYTGSIPLLGSPKFAAYSKENHSAYLSYATREVKKLDLATAQPKEVPFFNLPDEPSGLATAGQFVLAVNPAGFLTNRLIYSAAGVLTHSSKSNVSDGYSIVGQWDPAKRRMYSVSGDPSPNKLAYVTVDTEGRIGATGRLSFVGDSSYDPPMVVSKDGARVVTGSGLVFNIDSQVQAAERTNDFEHAVWKSGKLVTLHQINGLSQLQTWEGDPLLPGAGARQFNGTPVGLVDTPSGLVVITSYNGSPRFMLLNAAFETIYTSPVPPAVPAGLAVTGRSENSITLKWQDLSDNEDGFRVDYRSGNGEWIPGVTTGAGSTNATVAGLSAATAYEFRVISESGPLNSTASESATSKTLGSSAEPVGEPYNLRLSRIFNNRITLEWQDNAANETSFRIYRSTSPSVLGTPLSAPAGSTFFTDSGLTGSTLYYYRIQALNGSVSGDLSSQVSGRTPGVALAPSSPSSLAAKTPSGISVILTWKDNSTNEDEFIIERSGSPADVWSEIGRTAYNVNTFSDTTVSPLSSYTYRVKASNTSGSGTSNPLLVKTAKLGGEYAGIAMRGGGLYCFAFKGPDRIERYDLNTRTWLSSIPLQSAATALWVDASGVFVAEGKALIHYGSEGGSGIQIATGQSGINGLFALGDTLVFQMSGKYISMDKRSGVLQSEFSFGFANEGGYCVSSSERKVYFRGNYYLQSLEIDTYGRLVKGVQDSNAASYPYAARTFIFPDGKQVADDSGTVYSCDSLGYYNSLAGAFTDLDFHGPVGPILLRGDKLVSCSATLLQTGSFTLDSAGLRMAVSGEDAVVFFADAASTNGLRIQTVPLSQLVAPVAGPPVEPRGLAYTPDDVFLDKDGNVLLLSKARQSLFRWSTTRMNHIASLRLLGTPSFAGYSKQNHHVYFAYPDQVVRQIDLTETNPLESPLCNLPAAPLGFTMAGEYPYVAMLRRLIVFSPAGVNLVNNGDSYRNGNHNTWDSVTRRVYHFDDGSTSYNLNYETIDENGRVAGRGSSLSSFSLYPSPTPIRVSPDGSKVVVGNGEVFTAPAVAKAPSLANGVTDAAWLGANLVTARLIGGGTQLQKWSAQQVLVEPSVRQFNGTPVRLLALDDARLLLITLVQGVPQFTILNEALDRISISPVKPLPPAALAVTDRSTSTVSLRWEDHSDNESGFRIEYRPAYGEWAQGSTVLADATSGSVSGLSAGTSYEFQVIATSPDFESDATATVGAVTLANPDQPVGEPYSLRITRVFDHSVTLEWQDNADNETGFRILISTTASGPATELMASVGATSFICTDLTAGTTYFFKLQVVNGFTGGETSAQVNAKTLGGNYPPSPVSDLAVTGSTPTSVSLKWQDNSTNEENFLIERSDAAAVVWTQVGSVPFNSVTFTDGSASPNTSYSYRVRAANPLVAYSLDVVRVTTPKAGGEFAGFSIRAMDVYYFAFTGPDRIERFDLVSRDWLAPIPLLAAATALWADESGIFVAEDRTVIRFGLDGSGRSPFGNADATVKRLFTLNENLVFGPASGDLLTSNKRSAQPLSTLNYYYPGNGFSTVPRLNRAFFRGSGSSNIHFLEIAADGTQIGGAESPYFFDYPNAKRTFAFPNGARVADDSGTVYSTDSLTYSNSLGGAFTDLSFRGVDVPIVLRDNKLFSYTNTFLEAGNFTLSNTGFRMAVSGTDALVFSFDVANPHGLRIEVVPLSEISAPEPGKAIDPHGLAFTPDDVFLDRDGNLLLFSKANANLFRWSTNTLQYLAGIPLEGVPNYAAYSKAGHRAYFAYGTQAVREMDLSAAAPFETPLFNMPGTPTGLATAGEFVFAADTLDARRSNLVYDQQGNPLDAATPSHTSRVWTWEPVRRRMYFFRDDTSPNDLCYQTIDAAGGITGEGETPYHGDYQITPPIRVSPDGSKVIIGSGVVYGTADMRSRGSLPAWITDAVWRKGELLTIRASGPQTQIQRWNDSSLLQGAAVPLLAGTPLRLFALDSKKLALVTVDRGMPHFYILNPDLSISYDCLPDSKIPPLVEDLPFSWTPDVWSASMEKPLTITASVLPEWMTFTNGVLGGTPREADAGNQVNRAKAHRVVLRAVDARNVVEEKELLLSVVWQNDAPSFTSGLSPIVAGGAADHSLIDLSAWLIDPDGNDTHRWQLVSNSNPSLFSSIGLDENGMLGISYEPYLSGSSTVTVEVTDASGDSVNEEIEIVLPPAKVPLVKPSHSYRLNRATGLYEQKVTVKNIAGRAIRGFELLVSGLKPGVSLYNGTTIRKGGGTFVHNRPLGAGRSVTVVLKYYVRKRGLLPTPSIALKIIVPANLAKRTIRLAGRVAAVGTAGLSASTPTPVLPFAINRCERLSDGTVYLEFNTEPGLNYQVEYSEDAFHWKRCPEIMTTSGNAIQWTDRGWPQTDSSPASQTRRFYRVARITP